MERMSENAASLKYLFSVAKHLFVIHSSSVFDGVKKQCGSTRQAWEQHIYLAFEPHELLTKSSKHPLDNNITHICDR